MISVSRLEAFDKAAWQKAADQMTATASTLAMAASDLRDQATKLVVQWVNPIAQAASKAYLTAAMRLEGIADQQRSGASIVRQAAGELDHRKAELAAAKASVVSRPATVSDDGGVHLEARVLLLPVVYQIALLWWARSMTYEIKQILIRADAELASYDAALRALVAEAVPTPESGPIDLDDDSVGMTIDVNQQDAYGDCVTLAMLSGKGRADPQWVRDHLVWDPVKKVYVVTVYDPKTGAESKVEVDPTTLPSRGAQAYGTGKPTWLSVMEEGYRQKYPSVVDGSGATHEEVARMVTGQTVQRNVGSFDDIRKTLDGPPPGNVVVGTSGATEKQPDDVDPSKRTVVLPSGNRDSTHAYSVKGFDADGKIVLQNPWGPQGGYINGKFYPGEVHLTESEFKKWFNSSTRVPGK